MIRWKWQAIFYNSFLVSEVQSFADIKNQCKSNPIIFSRQSELWTWILNPRQDWLGIGTCHIKLSEAILHDVHFNEWNLPQSLRIIFTVHVPIWEESFVLKIFMANIRTKFYRCCQNVIRSLYSITNDGTCKTCRWLWTNHVLNGVLVWPKSLYVFMI